MMAGIATRTRPEGGAIANVVERFVTSALEDARTRGMAVDAVLGERLQSLSELVGGYDFAEVIAAYWRGHDAGDDRLKGDAIRWLRGEFTTKTDARRALGVRTIVDDDNIYDQLKVLARFVRLAGYGGLLVCLDELVNLYKLANTRARSSNYEQILRMLNDSLQGASVGLGFLLGGTPEFLMDERRGLYSYEALRSRLGGNRFAGEGLRDLSGPVIHLPNLTQEEIYVLLVRLREIYAGDRAASPLLPDEALLAFLDHCYRRVGEAYFRTPRNTIRAFLELLAVLDQNREASWRQLLGDVRIDSEGNPDIVMTSGPDNADDELAAFKLQ
jgi:hypothetical protein